MFLFYVNDDVQKLKVQKKIIKITSDMTVIHPLSIINHKDEKQMIMKQNQINRSMFS